MLQRNPLINYSTRLSLLNNPVHIEYDKKNKEVNLVAKTVMRKKGFKTGDKVLAVEGMLGFKDFYKNQKRDKL